MSIIIVHTLYLYLAILFIKREYIYFIFLYPILFHLNLDYLFGIDTQLFGIIDMAELNAILMLILLANQITTVRFDNRLKYYQRTAMTYIIICMLFDLFYSVRIPFISDMHFLDQGGIYRRTLRQSMYALAFFILIKRMNQKNILEALNYSFVVFAIFFSAATLFVKSVEQTEFSISMSTITTDRTIGIFRGGDENVLASLLSMIFGYFLANLENNRRHYIYYIAMFFILIGLINTGSRGGLLSLFVVMILFVFRNPTDSLFEKAFIFIIVGVSLFTLGDMIIGRLLLQTSDLYGKESARYYGLYSRLFKWFAYMTDFFSDWNNIWVGKLSSKPSWMRYSPHNVFIKILYFGGVAFLIPFLLNIRSLFKLDNSQNLRLY